MTADEKIQIYGKVTDTGEITLPRRFKPDVARLFSGREIVVTVERKRKKRSLNQNAYYWAVVVKMICEAMNDAGDMVSSQDVHEFLRFRFLKIQKIDEETAELLYEYSRSTSALKTFEFAEYIERCIQFAAEYLNIEIPTPYSERDNYSFPEQPGKKETRDEYLSRISEYVLDIFDRNHLRKYFEQNPDWQSDVEVKTLFNARWAALKD